MSHVASEAQRERRIARAGWMTAVSPCVLALGLPAQAQQAEEEASALEEVVVTSFRASLEDALQKKRASNQIIETVTSTGTCRCRATASSARTRGTACSRTSRRG